MKAQLVAGLISLIKSKGSGFQKKLVATFLVLSAVFIVGLGLALYLAVKATSAIVNNVGQVTESVRTEVVSVTSSFSEDPSKMAAQAETLQQKASVVYFTLTSQNCLSAGESLLQVSTWLTQPLASTYQSLKQNCFDPAFKNSKSATVAKDANAQGSAKEKIQDSNKESEVVETW
jgi:hypothetical protein